MRYTVFLKQCNGQYHAVVPLLPECVAHGKTRDEVLLNLKIAIKETLSNMEVTTIEVNHPNPQVDSNRWIETAGMFKEDPLFDDMLAEVKAYRQTLDG
jgi:predicted RNase H-like HicB family nuclease